MDDAQVNKIFNAIVNKAWREMGSTESTRTAYQLGLLRGMLREHLVDGVSWEELEARLREAEYA